MTLITLNAAHLRDWPNRVPCGSGRCLGTLQGERAPAGRPVELRVPRRTVLSSHPCTLLQGRPLPRGSKVGFIVSLRLPTQLPPTYRGMGIKLTYHLLAEATVRREDCRSDSEIRAGDKSSGWGFLGGIFGAEKREDPAAPQEVGLPPARAAVTVTAGSPRFAERRSDGHIVGPLGEPFVVYSRGAEGGPGLVSRAPPLPGGGTRRTSCWRTFAASSSRRTFRCPQAGGSVVKIGAVELTSDGCVPTGLEGGPQRPPQPRQSRPNSERGPSESGMSQGTFIDLTEAQEWHSHQISRLRHLIASLAMGAESGTRRASCLSSLPYLPAVPQGPGRTGTFNTPAAPASLLRR